MFVQTNPKLSFHGTRATVLSVNPEEPSGSKISLNNPDRLEDSHVVMRRLILQKCKLVDHPGCARRLSSFVLEDQHSNLDEARIAILQNRESIITRSVEKVRNQVPQELGHLFDDALNPQIRRITERTKKRQAKIKKNRRKTT